MNKLFTLTFILFSFFARADYWTQKASLPADDRAAAAGFALNGKGYLGTGIKFGGPTQFHNDFWEYDPATNSWLAKADFAGTARSGGVGFPLLGKGYIACGYDANIVQQDVWQYDQLLNFWTQKASLPGPGRNYTVAFATDSFAYIGTGYNSSSTNYQDFWQYNPVTNSWLQKADVGGLDRSSAIGFSANGKGFIGAGYSATYMDDFWQYDPALNSWTQKADIPPAGRSDASAFVINGFGYVMTGQLSTTTAYDLYKYDHNSNTWIPKATFPGPPRTNAVAFGIGNKGYLATGWDPSFNSLNDLWEYTADSTTGINEFDVSGLGFEVNPNPATEFIVISLPRINRGYQLSVEENIYITITDAQGKRIYDQQMTTNHGQLTINIRDFAKGIYLEEVSNGKQKAVKKFVKE